MNVSLSSKALAWFSPLFVGLLLLFSGESTAVQGQTVTLPKEVKVDVGRLASVVLEYDGDDLKYVVSPDLDCFIEGSIKPDPASKKVKLRLQGFIPGKFPIVAVSCKDMKLSEFAICIVIVEGTPPKPNPDPNPPKPEDEEADKELNQAVRTAAVADNATKQDMAKLAAAYQLCVFSVRSFNGKGSELFPSLQTTLKDAGVTGLPNTKKVISDYLNKANLPTDGTANLTQDQLKAILKILIKIALALLEASK